MEYLILIVVTCLLSISSYIYYMRTHKEEIKRSKSTKSWKQMKKFNILFDSISLIVIWSAVLIARLGFNCSIVCYGYGLFASGICGIFSSSFSTVIYPKRIREELEKENNDKKE